MTRQSPGAAKQNRKPEAPKRGVGSSAATRATNLHLSAISQAKAPGTSTVHGRISQSNEPKQPWREANADYIRRVLHKLGNIRQATEQAKNLEKGQERLSDLQGLTKAYTAGKTAYAALTDVKKRGAPETEIKRAEATYDQLLVAAEAMSQVVNSKRPGGSSASVPTDGLTASKRFRQNHAAFYADVKDKLDALAKRIKQGPAFGPLEQMQRTQEAFVKAREAYQELQVAKSVSNTMLSSELQVEYTKRVREATKLYNALPPHPRRIQAGGSNKSQSIEAGPMSGGSQMVLRGMSANSSERKGKGKAPSQ